MQNYSNVSRREVGHAARIAPTSKRFLVARKGARSLATLTASAEAGGTEQVLELGLTDPLVTGTLGAIRTAYQCRLVNRGASRLNTQRKRLRANLRDDFALHAIGDGPRAHHALT